MLLAFETGFVSRHPYSQQRNIDADALHYVGRFDNPATQFSLRAIDPERYQIINVAEGGYVMEEIEESKAFFQVYDGSVYMFQVTSSSFCEEILLHLAEPSILERLTDAMQLCSFSPQMGTRVASQYQSHCRGEHI